MGVLQPSEDRTKDLYLQGGKFYIAFENEDGSVGDYQYLGMTPSATATIETETLEHMQTEEMPPSTDMELVTKITATLSAAIDQISAGVIAMFYLGETSEKAQAAGNLDETLAVKPGHSYFLGGQKIGGLTVASSDDSVTYVEGTDYAADPEVGLLTILPDGSIGAGDTIHVTGTLPAVSYQVIEGMTRAKIGGKLRFVSDPISGKRRVWEFHKIQAVPSGDFALKSAEEYAQASFDFKLLKDTSISGSGLSQMMKVTEISA